MAWEKNGITAMRILRTLFAATFLTKDEHKVEPKTIATRVHNYTHL